MSVHQPTEPFLRIPRSFAQSYEFRHLGSSAKGVLIELWSRFNGGNNGDLYLSYREAETSLGYGRHTTARAFKELQEGRFIRQTSRSHWTGKKASRWWINGLKNATPKAIKGGLAEVEIVAAEAAE
jgi:hypothetical protein